MARMVRITLDVALVSVRTAQPIVSKVWSSAKDLVRKTAAKPIVDNKLISKLETSLDKVTGTLVSKMTIWRDKQYAGELRYLEKEAEKIRNKMGKENEAISKTVIPPLGTAWQYAKVEVVPPMTGGFFQGPGGQALENTVSKAAYGLISGLEGKIREIEEAERQAIREKEAAIQAEQDKQKAEAKKKDDERKKQAAEKLALEAKKAKEKEAKTEKPKEAEKKPEPPKAKKKPPKKDDKKK